MANTLTGLYRTIYLALNKVSRQRVGFIPAVVRNANAERAAIGDTIAWPVVQPGVVTDITPAATGPDPQNTVTTAPTATLTKQRSYSFYITGEDEKALGNSGTDDDVIQQAFENGFNALANEIEADIWTVAYKAASRAYGTAGTAPFATAGDMQDLANLAMILDDNGCPPDDRHLILTNFALLNLRGKQSNLFKVNEAGTDELLRKGTIGELEGFFLHQSNGIGTHVKGTGASYVADGAHAVDIESILLKTGTGTVKAGDVVTFAGDTNKYVVNTGVTAPGTIAIGQPGLRAALADGVAMTIGNNHKSSVGFDRNALFLAARAPAEPKGGDAADDAKIVTDPATGLSFEIRVYRQYHRIAIEIGIVWGVVSVKSEHIALLLG